MAVKELAQQVRTGSYRAPKTILGFFAVVVALVLTGVGAATGILSRVEALHHLIVWVLGFGALIVVAVLLCVFITAWKDPTALMLGQISGHEYIENRKLALGDSESSEYTEAVVLPSEFGNTTQEHLPLPKTDEGGAR